MDAADALPPAIGDLVWLSPEVGVHGVEPHWLRVLGVAEAMVVGHIYLRGYPQDDPSLYPRIHFVRLAGLVVEAEEW